MADARVPKPLRVLRSVIRSYGARGVTLRALHETRRRVGLFRAEPRHRPAAAGGEAGVPPLRTSAFRVPGDRLRSATDVERAVARGDRVVAGEYQAFRDAWRRLPETPAAWLRHPATRREHDGSKPWWEVPLLAAGGDIKDVWEPARFGWVYDLVRAYLLTGDDVYAAAFFRHLETWAASSPPFRGPHWACGQETSIRAVALLYAAANLRDAPSARPEALRLLAETLAASGERVHDAFEYAVAQNNNHAISEATGLLVLGHALGGVHPRAGRWYRRGRRWLDRTVREQVAPDGWYVQHSFSYLRVALDQCAVAGRVLRAEGDDLSPQARDRIAAAVRLLAAVMESASGVVPNHGSSDGALVHPVTLGGYRGYRPALTATTASFHLPLPGGMAPDPEPLAWLDLPLPDEGEDRPAPVVTGASGWASVRAGEAALFLRAGKYRSRPAHFDPLHLDLRWRGREVVVDAGTFAYNAPPPWNNGLRAAAAHNGPAAGSAERGPGFLWLDWPRARIRSATGAELVAESSRVRRTVRVEGDVVEVVDEPTDRAAGVAASDAAAVTVNWLLHPGIQVRQDRVTGDARLGRAREGDVRGWFSPTYGRREPSSYVLVEAPAGWRRIRTRFGLGSLDAEGLAVHVEVS